MSKLKKALEKAKEERGIEGQNFYLDKMEMPKSSEQKAPQNGAFRPELDICYSETKVNKIEEHLLKKGKIISLFHDIERIDEIKTLRTQVLQQLNKAGGNSILITSPNPCEGKTFTAINLAVSIAQELDRTVLLVDADLRRHNKKHKNFATDFFGTEMNEGLSDYLLGRAEIPQLLINPGIERLVLLPSGRSLANSAELLGSPRMTKLVNDIKSRYECDRIIIFDCASLLSCADPLVLSRYVDGIILVVEHEKTTSDDLRKSMELLKDQPLFGTVMNKLKARAN